MMKSIFTRTLSGGRSIRHLSSSPQVIVEKNADGPWLGKLNFTILFYFLMYEISSKIGIGYIK